MRGPNIIDESQLEEFRAFRLAPAHVYRQVPSDGGVLLINLPPGTGKSHRAQRLIFHALEAEHDLVIYVAPTRAIIGEIRNLDALPSESVVVLEPRPKGLCGPLDDEWAILEKNGCTALAKSTLCGGCPALDKNGGTCGWPNQMDKIGPDTRLVVLTEQYLNLNPFLIRTIHRNVEAKRTLVIFDEALFMTVPSVRRFARVDLQRFREALASASAEVEFAARGIQTWVEGINFLLDTEVELRDIRRFWANNLEHAVLATQRAGQRLFGNGFRYLAADLALLNSAVTTGQWREADTFEIVVRVDTSGCDVAVMAAYLDLEIVEERLQRPVKEVFAGLVFRHSKTRVVNIADPIGAARSLPHVDHFGRVVDFFLALILRNIDLGRRTVLVTKKRFLPEVKARIERKSLALGRPTTCVLAGSGKPFNDCGPTEIPLINYGIVGVNSLENFDSLYCVGSYYSRSDHLNAVYRQALPPESRAAIAIRTDDRRRSTYATDGEFGTRFHALRAAATHRMLERRTVLQAVGRVRPFTSPAEIILFQCDDFAAEFGAVEEFRSLADARQRLKVPTSKQMRQSALGERVRAEQVAGRTLRSIAAEVGIAPSTALLAANRPRLGDLLRGIRP